MTFSDVIESVKCLSTDEKQAVQELLSQYLREERREEIHQNFLLAKDEYQRDELQFSSNASILKKMLED